MDNFVAPWVRIGIMLAGTAVVAILAYYLTGSPFPSDLRQALVFQNALLLIVLGSSLLEHHFTKPADSAINSLMGLITLLSVYSHAPLWPWLAIAGYCMLVLLFSVSCVAVSNSSKISGWKSKLAKFTYRPAVVFGKARVLFSLVFLSGLWFFYSIQDPITVALVVFWGIFVALWPLNVPALITSWFARVLPETGSVGEIIRVDSPNILRVALNGDDDWRSDQPRVCSLPSGKSKWLVPLYSQFQDGRLLATGLLTNIDYSGSNLHKNYVYGAGRAAIPPSDADINESLGGGKESLLIGFVVENSHISTIKFEVLNSEYCSDGLLIWTQILGEKVYYQIVFGETQEESFAADKHGFQVASATQLGTLVPQSGFEKYEWLPTMNSPIFTAAKNSSIDVPAIVKNDFKLGVVPKSNIEIGGAFVDNYNHHTALLGITGSGKTELAFDLIRYALVGGIKVICIDLTAQYKERLSDLDPVDLSIGAEQSNELSERLFDVETGKFNAGDEKKALRGFEAKLKPYIKKSIEGFMSFEGSSGLGLIHLEEISNTKATLWITELYMSLLLKYAKDKISDKPRLLIVVEEAHTVMPEPNTMGLGDYSSKGLVAKIAQIALQGRKYGVGLLVIAQRTATVSKTVLTQCNTIISFTAYDDSSLSFLQGIYGKDYISLVPNLPPLHAIAFGKWIRSQKPIVFKLPQKEI